MTAGGAQVTAGGAQVIDGPNCNERCETFTDVYDIDTRLFVTFVWGKEHEAQARTPGSERYNPVIGSYLFNLNLNLPDCL